MLMTTKYMNSRPVHIVHEVIDNGDPNDRLENVFLK